MLFRTYYMSPPSTFMDRTTERFRRETRNESSRPSQPSMYGLALESQPRFESYTPSLVPPVKCSTAYNHMLQINFPSWMGRRLACKLKCAPSGLEAPPTHLPALGIRVVLGWCSG
jgi:hypothetical protein